jgi:hypothetical protein
MQETATINGAPPVPAAPTNGEAMPAGVVPLFPPERLQRLVAALEEPFDAADIKWRVTNTCQVGSRNGPQLRGQMLAYADPRAYTDRLNELVTPSGWTRDYSVQMVQNFERKERGATERSITAKIVVTCKVTIYGLGTHTGLGEEWADNDNAGTAAEAQAFKRACSCFGLGRYLYNLDGQWVDLDDHKRPLQTPNLPDWARPRRQPQTAQNGQRPGNNQANGGGNRAANNGRGGLYRDEVLGQVKALCGTVGFSLSKSVLRAIASVEEPDKIRDMAKLSAVFEKLQDTARGVERLRVAVAKTGDQRHSALCRELNLASESIDDIPDRAVLRQLVERLEAEAGQQSFSRNGSGRGGAQAGDETSLSELRGRLLQQAARVSGATKRTLAEVINEAAKGEFSLATLKTLGAADAGKVRAALTELERMAVAG